WDRTGVVRALGRAVARDQRLCLHAEMNLEAALDEAAQRGDASLPAQRLDDQIVVQALHLAEVERAVGAAPRERAEANALRGELDGAAAAQRALLALQILRHLECELLEVAHAEQRARIANQRRCLGGAIAVLEHVVLQPPATVGATDGVAARAVLRVGAAELALVHLAQIRLRARERVAPALLDGVIVIE